MQKLLLTISTILMLLTPLFFTAPHLSIAMHSKPTIVPKIQISPSLQKPISLHSRELNIPPLPPNTRETVAIVQLQQPRTEREIIKLLAPHPDLQLRHIFREALAGFSVKGPPASIAALAKDIQIISVSPVNDYHAQMAENVKIIGGEEIRGFYDLNDNRLTGKGVTVGVIDTGVDYMHPDLRRSYGG